LVIDKLQKKYEFIKKSFYILSWLSHCFKHGESLGIFYFYFYFLFLLFDYENKKGRKKKTL